MGQLCFPLRLQGGSASSYCVFPFFLPLLRNSAQEPPATELNGPFLP